MHGNAAIMHGNVEWRMGILLKGEKKMAATHTNEEQSNYGI